MKRTVLATFVLLALAACNEEDDTSDVETGTATSTASASSAEDTATADDGGGAMDGAQASAALAEVSQDAIDGCIDGLRTMGGAGGGTVLSTEFSEANSLVMLEDAGGTTWRCIVSNDGSNASLEAEGGEDTATADDGGGAMDGSASDAGTPAAGSPTDVTSFQGAPAGQAEGGLRALGFEATLLVHAA